MNDSSQLYLCTLSSKAAYFMIQESSPWPFYIHGFVGSQSCPLFDNNTINRFYKQLIPAPSKIMDLFKVLHSFFSHSKCWDLCVHMGDKRNFFLPAPELENWANEGFPPGVTALPLAVSTWWCSLAFSSAVSSHNKTEYHVILRRKDCTSSTMYSQCSIAMQD